MNKRIIIGLGVMALLLGGCVIGNRTLPEGTLSPTEDQAGVVPVRIETRPSGALVFSGGRAVGHSPMVVMLPVSRLGFFPAPTTVRVRFLAEDQRYGPLSVSANFTVLEKVPAAVIFTPDGFTWAPR